MKRQSLLIVLLLVALCIGCACEHGWTPATCITPAICKKCGVTEGKPLGHNWKDATCTEPKTCSVCGATEGEASGHKWEPATCEAPKICAVCDATEGSANGHKWQEATCTQPAICSVCDITKGEAKGHTCEGWMIVKEATCTEDGSRTCVCTVCNKELVEVIEKKDHTTGEWIISEPADYFTAGKRASKCTICDEELESEEYELTDEEKIRYLKKNSKSYDYKTIARYPDEYEGKCVKYSGIVFQVFYETLYNAYFLRTSGSNFICVVDYSFGTKILEDDRISVYGFMNGDYTYETVRGNSNTVPLMSAYYVELK